VKKFSSIAVPPKGPELAPGRLPYDYAKWQSEIWCAGVTSSLHKTKRTVGGWPSRSDSRFTPPEILSPDYSLLLPTIASKARFGPRAEMLFPNRAVGDQFPSTPVFDVEAMPGPQFNIIEEDSDPDPDSVKMVATLDTIYSTTGSPVFPQGGAAEHEDLGSPSTYYVNVAMTYYHGFDTAPMVMSGFDLWHYSKVDLGKLVDFVFQNIWGLQKAPIPLAASNRVAVSRGRPFWPVAPPPTRFGFGNTATVQRPQAVSPRPVSGVQRPGTVVRRPGR
jgi:hypothetical protein